MQCWLAVDIANTSWVNNDQVLLRWISQQATAAAITNMHNTKSNMNPTDWANRFVPLPPTEFPDDVVSSGSEDQRSAAEGSHLNPSLPCLNDIAGVDPFLNPDHATSLSSVSVESPATACSLFPAAASSLPVKQSTTPVEESDRDAEIKSSPLSGPCVEIIGQQTQQDPVPQAPVQKPLSQQERPEVELMTNTDPAKSNAEMHEYDLAMKVLSNVSDKAAAECREQHTVETGDSAEAEISSYWSQDNVSSFIPGVTPIGAYPVCEAFAQQVPAASATQADNEPEQPIVAAAEVEPETADLEQCVVQAEQDIEPVDCSSECEQSVSSAESEQVDPFASETFESVEHVNLVGPVNQIQQIDQVNDLQACGGEQATSAEPEVSCQPEVSCEPKMSCEAHATDESTVSETHELVALPEGVSQAIPQVPRSEDPSELFDSVEKSLSELQSINQLESPATFAPGTNAIDTGEEQPEPMAVDHTPQPEFALPSHTECQPAAPAFEPVDLTIARQPVSVEPDYMTQSAPIDLAASVAPAAVAVSQVAISNVSATHFSEQEPAEETPEVVDAPEIVEATVEQTSDELAPQTPAAEPDCQVIQVDGNDGYDFLDLKAFDVSNAMFCSGKILLDDGKAKFQIEHRNLNLAVFAGDFEVELS